MPERKIRARDVFEEYLLTHHAEDLFNVLAEDDERGFYSLSINFSTLFEEHVEVAEAILVSPQRLLSVFDHALLKALTNVNDERKDDFPEISLKVNVHIRLTGLPRCPELYRHTVPHTADVGRLMCLSGTAVRTTSPKLLECQREYMCLKCKHIFIVKADFSQHYNLTKPPRCPNPESCHSSAFAPSTAGSKLTFTKDYQEIKIQEQVQKLVVGTIPRSIWVTLEDDLVDTVKPGDDVLICGVVLQRWSSVTKDVRPSIELVIKSNNVTVRNKHRSGAIVTEDVISEFASFWDQYKHDPLAGRDAILASFCPQVYGLYVVKLALSIIIAGGVQKNDINGTRIRGESHLLLVGDPGTAKSQFLKYVSSLVPRCVLTTGIGTTSAGLTVAAIREEGEWALEAGALVLADGGICCIDEFNSIKEADRAAIHEAMEQQTISVAKAGLVCKLNSRCSILAATNPKGHYDPNESLTVNIALASPLLSRFDLILVLLDSRNPEWDKVVSSYILEGRDLSSAKEFAQDDHWSMEYLQGYFCYVRTFQPKMTPEAHAILRRYYQLQRQTDHQNQARTTIRLLESLVRLSQGHARLMMKEEVETVDAVSAVCLMETSMCGTSLIANTNPLHSVFPESPKKEYRKQVSTILQKLALNDILDAELHRLNEEEKECSSRRKNGNPVPSKSIPKSPSVAVSLPRRNAMSQNKGYLPNILELADNFVNNNATKRKSCSTENVDSDDVSDNDFEASPILKTSCKRGRRQKLNKSSKKSSHFSYENSNGLKKTKLNNASASSSRVGQDEDGEVSFLESGDELSEGKSGRYLNDEDKICISSKFTKGTKTQTHRQSKGNKYDDSPGGAHKTILNSNQSPKDKNPPVAADITETISEHWVEKKTYESEFEPKRETMKLDLKKFSYEKNPKAYNLNINKSHAAATEKRDCDLSSLPTDSSICTSTSQKDQLDATRIRQNISTSTPAQDASTNRKLSFAQKLKCFSFTSNENKADDSPSCKDSKLISKVGLLKTNPTGASNSTTTASDITSTTLRDVNRPETRSPIFKNSFLSAETKLPNTSENIEPRFGKVSHRPVIAGSQGVERSQESTRFVSQSSIPSSVSDNLAKYYSFDDDEIDFDIDF